MKTIRGSRLLRHQDQILLAALVVLALLAIAIWRWQMGGSPGDLGTEEPAAVWTAEFRVDVNSAEWPELAQLPEIGETLARRIVRNRTEEGPFTCPEDLTRVHGIGEKTLDRMRPYLSQASWSPDR